MKTSPVILCTNGYISSLAFLFFVLLMISSCKKKIECPYDKFDNKGNCLYQGRNEAQITLNGINFENNIIPITFYDNHFGEYLSFYISSYVLHPESQRWELNLGMSFRHLPFKEGKHYGIELFDLEFPERHTFTLNYANIDQITASYRLDTDWTGSYIELEEIDRINNTVKGHFHVRHKKEYASSLSFPDQIEVEGMFESTYRIRWE